MAVERGAVRLGLDVAQLEPGEESELAGAAARGGGIALGDAMEEVSALDGHS